MSNFYVNSVKRKMKFQKLDLQSMQNNDEDSLSNVENLSLLKKSTIKNKPLNSLNLLLPNIDIENIIYSSRLYHHHQKKQYIFL